MLEISITNSNRRRKTKTIIRVVICLAVLPALIASGATYYVATNGDDSAHAGTGGWGDAFLTISNAVAKAAGGETVLVSNGVYVLTREIWIPNGIVLTSLYGSAATILDGNARITTNRCLAISNTAAVVDGFTIINGYLATNIITTIGGGVRIVGGTLRNSTICSNMAYLGGGIYCQSGSVVNCVISNNLAQSMGGGIILLSGGVLRDSIIVENTNKTAYGGGIYMEPDANVSGCLIVSNYASSYGGGIYATGGTIESNQIVANNGYSGGGVYILGASVRNCTIAGNTSRVTARSGSNGGGGANITGGLLEDCGISNNIAAGMGGGILVAGGGGIVRRCDVVNNTAGGVGSCEGGGGLFFNGYGVLESCLIAQNTAKDGGGISFWTSGGDIRNCLITRNVGTGGAGGIYNYRTGAVLANCTIVSNYTAGNGGGVYFGSSNDSYHLAGSVYNTIIYGNSAGTTYTNYCMNAATNMQTVSNSCLAPALSVNYGLNNIDVNPQFVNPDPSNPDYRLGSDSTCINKGLNQDWMTYDLDGHSRIDRFSRIVDMGAYEFLLKGMLFGAR